MRWTLSVDNETKRLFEKAAGKKARTVAARLLNDAAKTVLALK